MAAEEAPLFAAGLGSNVGNRKEWFRRALAMLETIPGVDILAVSHLYESAGWGREGMDPFLNAAVAGHSSLLDASSLLAALGGIEDALGRQRTVRWGPRTLDLDLLAFGGVRHDTPELQLPHPWIARRPFVYLPFAELVDLHPDWPPLAVPHPEGAAIEADTRLLPGQLAVWGTRAGPANAVEVQTASEEETAAFARQLAWGLAPGSLLALSGGLGAGKSVVARAIARELGVTGPVQSPTYTLCRNYELAAGMMLEHWDLYRLASEDDLESTGFFTPESRDAIRLVEWAERHPPLLESARAVLVLEEVDADSRRLRLRAPRGQLPFAFRAAGAGKAVSR